MAKDSVIAPSFADIEKTYKKYLTGLQILSEGAKAETGQTPKEVIWSKNKARLFHYEPTREKRFPVPILMVYALINRAYVLDLMPGNSLVEHLSQQGFDIYLLDWGTPGPEDKELTFDNYVLDYIQRAVKKVLRHAHAEELTLLGFCMGGTMAAMYASLFPDTQIKNLLLLTTPIDFTPSITGFYGTMTSEYSLDPDLLVDTFGNIPGELIDIGNRLAKPVTNFVGTYVTMWDRVMHELPMETWLAMSKWVNDGVPFAGAAFKQWIRDFYQQNKLVKGEIKLRGQQVDLAKITCPVLSIAGTKDHICVIPQAEALMSLISSQDKEFLQFDAGHIGLVTGSGAQKRVWPRIYSWLEKHSK